MIASQEVVYIVDLRREVGAGPRTSVLDIRVPWHMFRYDCNVVAIASELKSSGEPGYTGTIDGCQSPFLLVRHPLHLPQHYNLGHDRAMY